MQTKDVQILLSRDNKVLEKNIMTRITAGYTLLGPVTSDGEGYLVATMVFEEKDTDE